MKNTLLALLTLFLMTPAAFADQAGRFDANTTYEPPAAHAPANVSRMFATSVPRTARTASVELPATGEGGMIIWTISERGAVSQRVTTPKGAIQRRFRLDETDSEVVHVTNPVAATYRVDVDMPVDAQGVMVVAAEPDSALTLSTWAAPLSRQPGEPVTLHAELRDGADAIANARITARLAAPDGKRFDEITLVDQGNGVYAATLNDLPANVPGGWQIRFEADGATASGTRFARTGLAELIAERGAADLQSIQTTVLGDSLRITANADVKIAGSYRLDVIAIGANKESLAWAEGARQLDRGTTVLTIDIPLSMLDGKSPERLDVRLLGLDPLGVADRVMHEIP